MKRKSERDACDGAGECYYNHPKLFKMDDDGYPEILLRERTTEQHQQEAGQAVEVCPSAAISVED